MKTSLNGLVIAPKLLFFFILHHGTNVENARPGPRSVALLCSSQVGLASRRQRALSRKLRHAAQKLILNFESGTMNRADLGPASLTARVERERASVTRSDDRVRKPLDLLFASSRQLLCKRARHFAPATAQPIRSSLRFASCVSQD